MKHLVISIFLILLLGCSDEIEVTIQPSKALDIEELCSSIEDGIDIEKVSSIMKGVGRIKSENTFGEKAGSGYLYFWHVPTDVEEIKVDPLKFVIPHKDTCLVKYDKQKIVYSIEFEYIDEENYQQKVKIMKQ